MSNLAVIENKFPEKQSRETELMALIKETYAKGATDEEVKFFAQVCTTQNLDPIKRQIYFTKIWDSSQGKSVFTPIVSIDGMRSKAEETGLYAGQTLPLFCGEDGVWKEIWTSKNPPFASKVGVYRKDFKDPIYAIAQFDAYVKKTKDGKITKFWLDMGYHMLAKCAEALALRKALPQKLSGLYTEEERHKDTIDVEFKKENEVKPTVLLQLEKVQESKRIFNFSEEFEKRKTEFMERIQNLCIENLMKMTIDEEFQNTFIPEFFQYFKDEYIKTNGIAHLEDLYHKKLTAKRLNSIAVRYNIGNDNQFSEAEIKDIKTQVYDIYMKDKTLDLMRLFNQIAGNYVKF